MEVNHDATWNIIHEKVWAEGERNALVNELKKIDNAIASLDKLQQRVIRLFYIEKKNWIQVTYEVNYRERSCRKIRDSAMPFLCRICAVFSSENAL